MASMKRLEIDIECYSSADLSKCGVYRYVEAPDFEILLFGYSQQMAVKFTLSTWHKAHGSRWTFFPR